MEQPGNRLRAQTHDVGLVSVQDSFLVINLVLVILRLRTVPPTYCTLLVGGWRRRSCEGKRREKKEEECKCSTTKTKYVGAPMDG